MFVLFLLLSVSVLQTFTSREKDNETVCHAVSEVFAVSSDFISFFS